MESYKLWWEEGDGIFTSGPTRRSFYSDSEFHPSILIIYASHLENPNWFFPMEILEGYDNTKEITRGTANHRTVLIYKSLKAWGIYCSLQAKRACIMNNGKSKVHQGLLCRHCSLQAIHTHVHRGFPMSRGTYQDVHHRIPALQDPNHANLCHFTPKGRVSGLLFPDSQREPMI